MQKLGGGIKRLIIIYLAFDLAYIALDVVMGSSFSINRLLTPSFALWYILSLIYWRVILQLLPQKLADNKWLIMTVSVLIGLGAGFIPLGTEMSFQRACSFLPFFFVGYYARQEGWVDKLRQWNKWPFVLLFVGLCVLSYICLPIFYCKDCYESISDCGMRALQMSIATLICIAALNITPKTMGRFTDVGKYTLIIYLLHPPMIKVMNVACSYAGIERNPLIALVMAIVIVAFIYSIRNLKVLKYIQ